MSQVIGLAQVLSQRRPIVLGPPALEMLRQFRRETCMVQDDSRSGTLSRQLKSGNRINAFGPACSSPGLDNAAVGRQLQIPSHDVPGKNRKCASNFTVNLSRAATRKRTELLGVQQHL